MRSLAAMVIAAAVLVCAAAPALAGPDLIPDVPVDLREEDPPPWRGGTRLEQKLLAQESFKRGNVFLIDGLYPAAVDAYRAALTHWDHPAINYNLALALVNLDRPVEMLEALERAMLWGPEPIGADRFARARELHLLVLAQIGTLDVRVPFDGAMLVVDGREVFRGPGTWRGRLRAGYHSVRLDIAGHEPWEHKLIVLGGETTRYVADLEGERIGEGRRVLPRWMPPTMMGLGLGSGIIGLMADGAGEDRAGYTLYGVGGGLLVTGALVAYLERDRSTERTWVTLSLMGSVPGVGVTAVGSF